MIKPQSPSLVLLDLDGTLTPVRSPWRYVYERLGTWDSQGLPILARYQAGEIDYTTFCRLDVESWENAGANLGTVLGILDEIPFPAESLGFVQTLVESGFLITIVSTGFERVAMNLAEKAGLAFSRKLRPVINGIRPNRGRLEAVLRVHEGNNRRGKGSWARRLVTEKDQRKKKGPGDPEVGGFGRHHHRKGYRRESGSEPVETGPPDPSGRGVSSWLSFEGPMNPAGSEPG